MRLSSGPAAGAVESGGAVSDGARGARKSRLRAVVEAVTVLAITVAFTLGLLEGALRLFAPQIQRPVSRALFAEDRGTRFRNQPGAVVTHDSEEFHVTYRINSQGLREDHPIDPPAPNTTRLLAIGDSFTFGWGVAADQAFPHLLNGSHAANGQPVESLNAGVAGYGTDLEVAWMHEYGWILQPKIVLVGFYVGNDVEDVMRRMKWAHAILPADQPTLDAVEQARADARPTSAVDAWLQSNSHAYVFLSRLFARLAPSAAGPPGIFDDAYNYLTTNPAERAVGWQHTTDLLDELRWKARGYGATLVVVAMPTREQIDARSWHDLQATAGVPAAALDRDLPQAQLAAWSARTGAPLIDLLPGFRAAASGPALYYHADPHWTPAGQALAAQLIRAGLVRLGAFGP